MADKLMYIPNNDTENSLFCTLQLLVKKVLTLNLMNQPINFYKKFPVLLRQRIRKRYQTLGTSVINSPLSPSFQLITTTIEWLT